MTERLDLDRMRDLVEGTLAPDESAALEARLRADPALGATFSDLEDVFAAGDDPVAPCDVPFERLALGEVDAPPRAAWRRWAPFAAAAAILVAGLVGLGAGGATRDGTSGDGASGAAPVALAAIPTDAVDGIPTDPRVPTDPQAPIDLRNPTLAALPDVAMRYVPMDARGLRFVEDVDAGRALARATSRPMLVFVFHPTCPLCEQLSKTTFRDVSLADMAERFVLVKANVEHEGASLAKAHPVGWPIFVLYGLDGREQDAFGGVPTATALRESLRRLAGSDGSPVPWSRVRDVARALRAARAARDAAERAAALATAREGAGATSLAAVVDAAAHAASVDAAAALREARVLATRGALAEALARLDRAIDVERGGPYEADLTAVRARLARDGRFPRVVPVGEGAR